MTTPSESLDSMPRHKILDLEKFLPFGETLRGYLRQSFVKSTDLSEILRMRGVFIQSPDKEDLISILSATLISPAEFQTLLDCRRDRDLKEKIFHRNRNWKSGRTLLQAANADVHLEELEFQSTEKSKLLGKPTITAVAGNQDHIEVEFTVQRTRQSLDWSNEESQFKGKVSLKKEVIDGNVIVSIMHTSPETKEVAEKLARLIEDSLRKSGDIGEPTDEDQILYLTFDNTQRADFLLSLTGECKHEELSFVRLTALEALTDTTKKIPENCKDLIEGFEQIRLKGELHKSAYCKRREIYPYVRFYRMDARFNFKVTGAEGECGVRFEFADYGMSEDEKSEFAQEVEVVSLADNFKHVPKANVKKPLQDLVARIVAEKFKGRHKAQPVKAPTASRQKGRSGSRPDQTGTLFDMDSRPQGNTPLNK